MYFSNVFKNSRVLITGDTGFKGSWLSNWLLLLGAEVHAFSDRVYDRPNMFEATGLDNRLSHWECDICDAEAVYASIAKVKPNFVFHLAAQAIVSESYRDPIGTFQINAMGTAHVLDGLRRYNSPCTAVFITSDKCYENKEWIWGYRETDRLGGKDPYSASKAAAELVIYSFVQSFFGENHPVKIASGRAGNVIGGGDWAKDRIVPDAARNWSSGKTVTIRRPNATRPWQHVLEPISGYLRLAELLSQDQSVHGESYNFGPDSTQDVTVHQLLEQLAKTWTIGIDSPITVENNDSFGEAGLLKLNCDKALAHLDWRSVLSFDECAELTAGWYKEFYAGSDPYVLTANQIARYEELAKQRGMAWT